jgi:hypothetical protein
VVGLDEARLALYSWSEAAAAWVLVGGTVDTTANVVSAEIDTLRLYAIAPVVPSGQFGLWVTPDTLAADGVSLASVVSDPIRFNNGELVDDGTLFSAFASVGTITTADLDTIPGVQVASMDGRIAFGLQAPQVGWAGDLIVESLDGQALGRGSIAFIDSVAPPAPVIIGAVASDSTITVSWQPVDAIDVTGYRLYYDDDFSGPPYDGDLSLDVGSPIDVGLVTTRILCGTNAGSTYYLAVAARDASGNWSSLSEEVVVGTPTSVPPDTPLSPLILETRLYANRPNPFRGETAIAYDLASPGSVRLKIFDATGRLVRTLVDQVHPAGSFVLRWEGRGNQGQQMPTGVYFARLETQQVRKAMKMVMIR